MDFRPAALQVLLRNGEWPANPRGQRMRDSISMKQMSLGAGFERKSRRTRKREFPDEMNCVLA